MSKGKNPKGIRTGKLAEFRIVFGEVHTEEIKENPNVTPKLPEYQWRSTPVKTVK